MQVMQFFFVTKHNQRDTLGVQDIFFAKYVNISRLCDIVDRMHKDQRPELSAKVKFLARV